MARISQPPSSRIPVTSKRRLRLTKPPCSRVRRRRPPNPRQASSWHLKRIHHRECSTFLQATALRRTIDQGWFGSDEPAGHLLERPQMPDSTLTVRRLSTNRVHIVSKNSPVLATSNVARTLI